MAWNRIKKAFWHGMAVESCESSRYNHFLTRAGVWGSKFKLSLWGDDWIAASLDCYYEDLTEDACMKYLNHPLLKNLLSSQARFHQPVAS
jgi:hypothetical protein